jgi:geranylgeranyl pyrophosphate synthase
LFVGLTATNDGLLLDNAIDLIVRQAIPDHPKVETIIQNIYEAKRRTVIGQILDCDTHDVTDFKWSRYKAIVDNKTSHYTYYLPLTIAFNLADRSDSLQQLRQLAYKLGYLFQVSPRLNFISIKGHILGSR